MTPLVPETSGVFPLRGKASRLPDESAEHSAVKRQTIDLSRPIRLCRPFLFGRKGASMIPTTVNHAVPVSALPAFAWETKEEKS